VTTKGTIYMTYTPIKDLTPMTLRFLPQTRILTQLALFSRYLTPDAQE